MARKRRTSGGVDKLPSGRYRARVIGPDAQRHTRTFATKADADAWIATQRTDMSRGDWIDPTLRTSPFSQWATEWLDHLRVRPNTYRQYEVSLRVHDLPVFGKRPVGSITRAEVRRFIASLLDAGAAPGTAANARKVLRLVLNEALEANALKANPCDRVRVPRGRREEMVFLTPEQINVLAHEIANPPRPKRHPARTYPQYGLLVRFAAFSGLRPGEIAALRVGRVNVLRCTVDVTESASETDEGLAYTDPKTYERRTVPIPRSLARELGELIAGRGDPDAFVFTSPEGGPLVHSNYYSRHFKPAVIRAGLPKGTRAHDLRHTAAALMVSQGAHLLSVKERLGHSSINVTYDRYGHLYPSLEEALTDRLDEVYGQTTDESVRSRFGHVAEFDRVEGVRSDGESGPHLDFYKSPRSDSNRRPDAYKAPALAN